MTNDGLVCGWCIYRDQDTRTNPKSPVNRRSSWSPLLTILGIILLWPALIPGAMGACEPVCIGDLVCDERLERHR
jgi:hypothetical protein